MKKSNFNVASLWSGGKDSCFSCFRAIQRKYNVKLLFSLIDKMNDNVAFHTFNKKLLQAHSKALEIPSIQRKVILPMYDREGFEKEIVKFIYELSRLGIKGLVAGYRHHDYQRLLLKKICSEHNFRLIEPLFGINSKVLLRDMIKLGFKAIITEVLPQKISADWVGKLVDKRFLQYLMSLSSIDFAGDYGEYHTLILDGPLFKKRLEIQDASIVKGENSIVLKIKKYRIVKKKALSLTPLENPILSHSKIF